MESVIAALEAAGDITGVDPAALRVARDVIEASLGHPLRT
jgi:hypothetical protein